MGMYGYKKRKTRLFDKNSSEPFSLSRSRLENFVRCPRCFYLDRRLGVDQPSGFPFTLNSAVDTLLKKEFDIHRAAKSKHPLMDQYGVDAVPFQHEKMDEWRYVFNGVRHLHEPTNFTVFGAVDDIWINPSGELHVVDYKATAKNAEVNIDADWQDGYKRQMEIYQWLLRKNDFKVSDTAYFVYANGKTDREAFDGKLEFDIKVIPYKGDDSWIDDTLLKARKTLVSDTIPGAHEDCEYCAYRRIAREEEEK